MSDGTAKTPQLFVGFGRLVDTLRGRYLVTEDVGIDAADIAHINTTTPYVALAPNEENAQRDGNFVTALGVRHGIRAALEHVTGSGDLAGRRVAIQGLGHVGRALAHLLHRDGAELLVTDLDDSLITQVVTATGAIPVTPEAILAVDGDVLAPCALGAVINERTRGGVRRRIVAGAANNVLTNPENARVLQERGIAYVPDYVFNAGGMIWEAGALSQWGREATEARIEPIAATVRHVFDDAEQLGVSPTAAADRLAEQALVNARNGPVDK